MLRRNGLGRIQFTFAIALFGVWAIPAQLSAQGVSYAITPTYEEYRWDDPFGLEDARLVGVRAALEFGPFFSLQPYYAWKDEVGIREGLVPPAGAEVPEFYDVETFGATLQVNFGRNTFVPFVRGGGGVLRTTDSIEGERDRILLRGGGGVRFGLGSRASAEVFAERFATRLNESFVPGAVDQADIPEDGITSSLLIGAGVRVPLGGGYQDLQGVSGILPGIFVEPFAARIDFDDELRLDRQHVAGARAGIDFNQNVGLRAFYWRGVDDDYKETVDIEGFGAEAQLALNAGSGISPFLVVGAGRVNFRDEFLDLDGAERDKEDHLTLGGGVAVGLSDRTRIELGARNLLMTVGSELEDVSTPDELVSNWQYSAGISIGFGARPRPRFAASDQDQDQDERERLARELAAVQEENRRLRAGESPAAVPVTSVTDTVTAPRTITIPVPEVGEIILRYGAAYARAGADSVIGAVPSPQIEDAVRDAVRDELDRLGVQPGAQAPAQPQPAAQPTVQVAPAAAPGVFLAGRRLGAILPYGGIQVSSPEQLLFGVRGDLGVISGAVPLDVIPDIVFGLGGGSPTLMVGLNTRFGWNVGFGRNLFPYLEAGVAVASRKFLTVNIGYGAEFDLGSGPSPIRAFVHHRGVAAFDEHQFIAGVRLAR